MLVFKTYFKILRKYLVGMSIYLFIFLFFAILMTFQGASSKITNFTETKNNIAFINYDKDSKLASGLHDYLAKNSTIVSVADNPAALQDALFFGRVDYIIKVPKGFSENFLSGDKSMKLQKTTVAASSGAVYMDFLVNRYLNTASLYKKSLPDITESRLVENLQNDLSLKSDVVLKTSKQAPINNKIPYFFRYLAYSVMAIMVLGVTSIMLIYNEGDVRRRNLCSPLKTFNMNMQLFLGNMTFAVMVWFVMIALSVVITRGGVFNSAGALMMLNTMVFTLVSLGISFFIGVFIKSRNAQQAIANVLSLGMCFISGVFVPQELLGQTVLSIAKFTPAYWYVKAVNALGDMSVFSAQNLKPVFFDMLIQLGFAAAIVAVTLVVIKQKRVAEA